MAQTIKFFLALLFAGIAILFAASVMTGSRLYWTSKDQKIANESCRYFGVWFRAVAPSTQMVVYKYCDSASH